VTEWWWLAQNEIMEMTKRGVPGVWTYNYYDGWVPNYMFWIGVTHNSIGRFYETQSYGGGRGVTDGTGKGDRRGGGQRGGGGGRGGRAGGGGGGGGGAAADAPGQLARVVPRRIRIPATCSGAAAPTSTCSSRRCSSR
jgi:hypothetical protein